MTVKIYSPEDLKKIIDAHALWLKGDAAGIQANLYGANLESANLHGANLYGANLHGANLHGANLYGANLESANLRSANLQSANLYGANLHGANLYGANLHGANLYGANLYGANLYGANLESANLCSANLRSATLDQIKNWDKIAAGFHFSLVPQEGAFIGWKKVRGGVVLKLQIPANALRVSTPLGRKCRASSVKVLEATKDGKAFKGELVSLHDIDFTYAVGKVAKAPSYDPTPLKECTGGIHFFITKAEAEGYRA